MAALMNLKELLDTLNVPINKECDTDNKNSAELVPYLLNFIRNQCDLIIGIASQNISPETLKPNSSPKKPAVDWTSEQADCDKNILNRQHRFEPPALDDQEAFPPIGTTNPTKPRRINPTTIKSSQKKSYGQFFGASEVFKSAPLADHQNLSEERNLLKTNKNLIKLQSFSSPVSSNHKETETFATVQIEVKSVTQKSKLDALIQAYSFCLEHGLIPNLSTELFFLFQLLLVRVPANHEKLKGIFGTAHNCVYFSVSVLERCPFLWALLNRASLEALSELSYLSGFSETLVERMRSAAVFCSPGKPNNTSASVAFEEDKDGRDNFPSEHSFSCFRKQRDLFCELLKKYPTFSVDNSSTEMKRRVTALIHVSADSTNLFHLSRYFLSQLIAVCCHGQQDLLPLDEESLQALQETNPKRFQKLQNRLFAPNGIIEPNLEPFFPDLQSFFKEFLDAADSSSFHRLLIDQLVVRITELNEAGFTEISSSELDEVFREKISLNLQTLKLLAKFLGYLHFLPYRSSLPVPPKLRMEQRNVRNLSPLILPLDFNSILQRARKHGCLIFVVPWLIDFCIMMDPTSSSLPISTQLNLELLRVYRQDLRSIRRPFSALILKLSLGVLFESPAYPREIFFQELSPLAEGPLPSISFCLDESNLISKKLFQTCCPSSGLADVFLKNYFASKKKPFKKIKPISSFKPSSSNQIAPDAVQAALEDNFFKYNIPAIKKSVDFVAERVYSLIVQSANHFLPAFKASCSQCGIPQKEEDQAALCVLIRGQARDAILKNSASRCQKILPLLLGDLASSNTVGMAAKIAARVANEKSLAWMNTNLTDEILMGTMSKRAKEISLGDISKMTEVIWNETIGDQNISLELICLNDKLSTVSVTKVLSCLRHSMLLFGCQEQLEVEAILELMEKGNNFDQCEKKCLSYIFSDWFLMLVVYHPSVLTEPFLDRVFSLLEEEKGNVINLICERNLDLLSLSPQPASSWTKLTRVLRELLTREWLGWDEFEGQCLGVLKHNWDREVLNRLAKCLQDVVQGGKHNSCKELISWLALFCKD